MLKKNFHFSLKLWHYNENNFFLDFLFSFFRYMKMKLSWLIFLIDFLFHIFLMNLWISSFKNRQYFDTKYSSLYYCFFLCCVKFFIFYSNFVTMQWKFISKYQNSKFISYYSGWKNENLLLKSDIKSSMIKWMKY